MRIALGFLILYLIAMPLRDVGAQELGDGPPAEISSKGKEVPENQVGLVVAARGKAKITRHGKEQPIGLLTPIFVGDLVKTAVGALLQIEFLDHSKVTLAGDSDYLIEAYSYDGTSESESVGKINNGGLAFYAGKVGQIAPQNYKIRTAMATVGIRGTSGDLRTLDGSLPGTEPELQIMKSGGIGLTLELNSPPGSPPAPPLTILESGQGFVINGEGVSTPIEWPVSPFKVYQEQQEDLALAEIEEQDVNVAGGEEGVLVPAETVGLLSGVLDSFSNNPIAQIFQVEEIVQGVYTVQEAEEANQAVEEGIEGGGGEFVVDGDYSGMALIARFGDDPVSFFDSVELQSSSQFLLFHLVREEENLLFPLPSFDDGPYSSVKGYEESEGGSFRGLFHVDNRGEFFVFNDFSLSSPNPNPTIDQLAVGFIGVPAASANLPHNGLYIYSRGNETNPLDGFRNVLLGDNGSVPLPLENSVTVLDFGAGKAYGAAMGAYSEGLFSIEPGFDIASIMDHGSGQVTSFLEWDPATNFVAHYADIGPDGSLSNFQVFFNLGYRPTNLVNIGELNEPLSGSAAIVTSALTGLSGSGVIYGADHQGLGIHLESPSGSQYVSGGFLELPGALTVGNNGLYEGYARGLMSMDTGFNSFGPPVIDFIGGRTAFLNVQFGVNGTQLLSGSGLILDYSDFVYHLAPGAPFFAGDVNSVFSVLVDGGGAPISLDADKTFMQALPLPGIVDSIGNVNFPEDVFWGTFNAIGPNNFFPGLHNFFAVGIPAPENVLALTSYDSLFFSGPVILNYSGAAKHTHYQQNSSPYGFPFWTDAGISSLQLDLQSGTLTSYINNMVFFPNGTVAFMKGSLDLSSPSDMGTTTSMTYITWTGDNDPNGMFSSNFSGLNVSAGWQMTIAGGSAQSAVFEWERDAFSPLAEASTFGVGVAGLREANYTGVYPDRRFVGVAYGLLQDDTPDGAVGLAAANPNYAAFEFEFGATKPIITAPAVLMNQATVGAPTFTPLNASSSIDLNEGLPFTTFIDKNAWGTLFEANGGTILNPGGPNSISTIDTANSVIIGLPGTENFEHVGWGLWTLQDSSGPPYKRAFGYLAHGDSITGLPDAIATLPVSGSLTYVGSAIGHKFDTNGGTPAFISGQFEMTANFTNGSLMGEMQFSPELVVSISGGPGSITSGAAFSHNSQISVDGGKTFQGPGHGAGHFFGNGVPEVAGAFRAVNPARDVAITGAYVGKSNSGGGGTGAAL